MKNSQFYIMIILVFSACLGNAQTPAEQKQIQQALKTRDSMMNLPEIKAALAHAKAMQYSEQDVPREEIKTAGPIHKTKEKDAFYRKNTLTSDNNQRLIQWKNGQVDIMYARPMIPGQSELELIKVGSIKDDGEITINLPETMNWLKPISKFRNLFFDIRNPSSYKFSNANARYYMASSFMVYKNNKFIGLLRMGDSIRTTENLTLPSNINFGDAGYLLYYIYVNENCILSANENWKGEVAVTDTPLMWVETNVDYELDLKKGWNLAKISVIGKYEFRDNYGNVIINRSWYKKHLHTIIESFPTNANYYYKANSY